MYLEQARADAMASRHEPEKRIPLESCIFCPAREGDVCLLYRQGLEDRAKKPAWCRYTALIMDRVEFPEGE